MNRLLKAGIRTYWLLYYSSGFSSKFKTTPKMLEAASKLVTMAFSSKYLIYTNVMVASLLSSLGDVIEQKYEKSSGSGEKWNSTRTKHMALTGAAMGIASHFWYSFLDGSLPGCSLKIVSVKILLDQLIGVPIDMMVFFGTFAILKGMTWDEFAKYLKGKVWKLYLAEMVVWPSAQFVNFYFLPRKYRVLYDNFVCLGYDIFISQLAHKEAEGTKSAGG